MKKSKEKMVFVFDLDKTIGYFTQVAIFIEGIEDYIGRNGRSTFTCRLQCSVLKIRTYRLPAFSPEDRPCLRRSFK